jgi:hypothetical protein
MALNIMIKIIKKKNAPLIFLTAVSVFWSYYYTTINWFNDYGENKNEIWLLIDTFLTLPLLCFYCFWDDKKTAAIKTLVYAGLLVLLGSYIIPQLQKNVWLYLENIRYIVIIGFVMMEIIAVFTVVFAIKALFNNGSDPDEAIAKPLVNVIGESAISSIMQIEARVWTFLLFPKKIKRENYNGIKHFNCHLKDGTHSFLLGFIIITCFQLPIDHTLLYFIWAPFAANVVSGLTLISLIYFIAQYRAIAKRPVSFTQDNLIIRYSLSNPFMVDLNKIESININTKKIYRNKKYKRYNLFGIPNIEIHLKPSKQRPFNTVYLGLDNPQAFINYYRSLSTVDNQSHKD